MPNLVALSKSDNLLHLGQVTAYLSYYFRKAILEYCSVENKAEQTNVLMEFVRRIECNSSAIRTLVEASIKNGSKSYLKLSIGLIIRSCLIDSILGLYLSVLDADAALDIINEFNQDYVRAMPDRYEVYMDRCAAVGLGDDMLKSMYGLQIEDNFPHYIDWSSYHGEESSKKGLFKIKSGKRFTIANAIKFLQKDSRYSILSKKLYAYYREYSQYEHFSVYAHTRYTTPYDDDMPAIAKPFEYITQAVEYIGINMAISKEIVKHFEEARIAVMNLQK